MSAGASLVPRSLSLTQSREYRKHRLRDGRNFWGKVTDYVHGKTDNSEYAVDGVSNKQYPIKLDWRRPLSVRRIHPSAEGSGDVTPLAEIDLKLPLLRLKGSPVLSEASPEVKKVLSLEYARNRDIIDVLRDDMVRSVQQHPLDYSSLEVCIAQQTIAIRQLQKQLLDNPRNKNMSHVLKMKVDNRRVLLRRLREEDYKLFEWLLEKLGIVYKPRPFIWEKVERKKHLIRLTDLWCEEFKQSKLNKMKQNFRAEQPKYLRTKAETLR